MDGAPAHAQELRAEGSTRRVDGWVEESVHLKAMSFSSLKDSWLYPLRLPVK